MLSFAKIEKVERKPSLQQRKEQNKQTILCFLEIAVSQVKNISCFMLNIDRETFMNRTASVIYCTPLRSLSFSKQISKGSWSTSRSYRSATEEAKLKKLETWRWKENKFNFVLIFEQQQIP